jgi:capsular polysaccharide biosynthesis protein
VQESNQNTRVLDEDRDLAALELNGRGGDFLRVDRSPYVGVITSAVRHPILLVVPIIVCLAAAVAYGVHRSPKYTATTRMQVTGLNLASPGALSAYSSASAALATTYARNLDGDAVATPVATKVHLPIGTVRKAISASPVPNSPVFDINATAKSSAQALTMVNETARSLQDYVGSLNTYSARDKRIFQNFRESAASLAAAQLRAFEARQAYGKASTPKPESVKTTLRRANADVQTAELRTDTYRQEFETTQQQTTGVALVQVVRTAHGASSDKTKKLEIYLFAALVGGTILGLALSTLRENRPIRRLRAA